MTGPLAGLQVIDLSSGTAGAMTCMLLTDLGATVTRVDRPGVDPLVVNPSSRVWHRGKRSVETDLETDAGRAVFDALACDADVVLVDFAPGRAAALGIDYAALTACNPRVITCTITGYGDHPRHRDRPSDDALVAARTGLLYDQKGRRGGAMEFIMGRPGPAAEFDAPDGLVRGADRAGPIFPRTMWPSVGATYFATLGVLAALRARERTGRGQEVSTSLLQGALAAVCLSWQRVEQPDAPLYWMWPIDGRSIEGLFECADGRWVHHWTIRPNWVVSCAAGDTLTPPDLTELYRDDPDRMSMEEDGLLAGIFLHEQLAAAFKKFPSHEWIAAADGALMGVALVRSPAEALADPAFLADGCVVELDDPDLGRIRHCGALVDFSDTPVAVQRPAPRLGQHNADVTVDRRSDRVDAPGGEPLAHPLQGIRVIDLGLGVAGPFAGRVLADLGADVIKVNALYDGFWAGTHMGLGTNRGKRSIAVNLKTEAGRAVLHRLVASADVVTTNWRPGAAVRLGLDDETLAAKHPHLVFCNSRGYERGARSTLPGTDQTAAALTGTEWADGACDHGNPPLWSRSNMGDSGNGLLSAIAITAALYARERTGRGQQVGTSIVNAGLLHTSYAWIHADGTPGEWATVDRDQVGLASSSYRMYRCADDRWLFIAAVDAGHRRALCAAVGEPEAILADDAKLAAALEHHLASLDAREWFDLLDRMGVPVEIVDEEFCRTLFDDPDARMLGLVAETWSGAVGRFEDPGLLVELSDTPGVIQRGPSMCGEHTREILVELGYNDADVDALAADDVVLDAPVVHP